MDLSSLVGKTIIHSDPVTNGITGRQVVKTKWIVVAAYPHYVQAVRTCENGTVITECFTKGELVQMGILQSRKKSHYMVGEREGTRWERSEQNG